MYFDTCSLNRPLDAFMSTTSIPVAEINTTAIALLCRELGAVNTARFLNQFTVGLGDYTAERDRLHGDTSVSELVEEIKQRRAGGKTK